MAAIGFVLHHERAQAAELAREAAAWLLADGHEVRIPRPDADIAGLGDARVRRGDPARGPRPGGEPGR